MNVYPDKLPASLKKHIAPIYLIYGDEPLQMREAVDAVRARVRAEGYLEREVLDVTPEFRWDQLQSSADSLSLFSSRRLLDLRLPSGKPGAQGSQALRDYAQRPPEDAVLLISCGKLDKSALKGAWFKALDALGVTVAVREIPRAQLPQWLNRRLLARGLHFSEEAVALLVERVQGNLLAAMQEVEKLELLHGKGNISAEQVEQAVADSARFSLYALSEAVLLGDIERVLRVFYGLQAEGTAANLLLWLLSRDLRLLAQLSFPAGALPMAKLGIWSSQQGFYQAALKRLSYAKTLRLLQRCAQIERLVKGQEKGDAWQALLQLALTMAGFRVLKR
ncbi:MAG: DNA polymerase III subunit delta [Gammaproteobacteria bacterium]|nr:DNA polymerase III subunit delta [Gammaproteobacteria bacterium]